MADDQAEYRIDQEQDQFVLRARSGQAVLTVRDAASAAHYLELLNRAYRAGFKAGLRQARRG